VEEIIANATFRKKKRMPIVEEAVTKTLISKMKKLCQKM